VKEEEVVSDADFACFACHNDSVDTLLLREHPAGLAGHLSSLAAVLKMQDVLGSQREDSTALMDLRVVQQPVASRHGLNGCGGHIAGGNDWDALFRRLGWSGSWKPVRSTACQRKQLSQQQQQGMCRVVGRGQAASKRAGDVQEASHGGTAQELTDSTAGTWSIDTMTFSSLHLMSVQSRSRQRRTGAVKPSSQGDDTPAPTALAALKNGATGSWQAGKTGRHDGRREDNDTREVLRVVLGLRSDCSAPQNTSSNVACRVRQLREMNSPASFPRTQQNPDSADTAPTFGAAVTTRGLVPWEQDALAALAAYPRPHDVL